MVKELQGLIVSKTYFTDVFISRKYVTKKFQVSVSSPIITLKYHYSPNFITIITPRGTGKLILLHIKKNNSGSELKAITNKGIFKVNSKGYDYNQ